MVRAIVAVFLGLHGLVHLLYLGQSAGLFELRPGLTWPTGSWLLSKLLVDRTVRIVADAFCVLAALGFAVAAVGLAFDQSWWRPVVAAAAILSALLYILFWNGQFQRLDQQGAIALFINAAILVVALVLRWPR